MSTSNELRLLFARSGDSLTYRVAPSWGGDAGETQPFLPFLGDKEYEDLRWYLEEYMDLPMGGALVRARTIEQSLAGWGRKLFAAVFDNADHRELFNALVDGPAPRLLTVGTKDLDVLRLPWELMADGRGPLTRRGVTLRRQLESARRPEAYDAGKLPLRILLAVSRPDDAGFLDPRHTTRAMLDALAPLGAGVVVDFCRPATLDKLERMLRDADRAKRPYHIVHFDGHPPRPPHPRAPRTEGSPLRLRNPRQYRPRPQQPHRSRILGAKARRPPRRAPPPRRHSRPPAAAHPGHHPPRRRLRPGGP